MNRRTFLGHLLQSFMRREPFAFEGTLSSPPPEFTGEQKEITMDPEDQAMEEQANEDMTPVNDLPQPPPAPGEDAGDPEPPAEEMTEVTPPPVPEPAVQADMTALSPAQNVDTVISDGNADVLAALRDIREMDTSVAQAEEDAEMVEESLAAAQAYVDRLKAGRLDTLRNAKSIVDTQRNRLDRTSARIQTKIDNLSSSS